VKKSPWIVCCLAAVFVGQISAFAQSTTAVYSVTTSNFFKVGKTKVAVARAGTVTFLNNSNVTAAIGTTDITGSYTLSKRTNDVLLVRNSAGLAAISNEVVALLYSNGVPSTVTISVKPPKSSAKIALKDGLPITGKPALSDTITGKLSETVNGKIKSKGFSLKTLWVDWTKTSGSAF
jgi:hypothetical protein